MLAHNLEEGEWSVRGHEVSAKVAMSQVLIDFALGAEPKRIIQTALAKTVGKPLKFKMVSGGTPVTRTTSCGRRGRRTAPVRAAAPRRDPVVQRMQENSAPRFAP